MSIKIKELPELERPYEKLEWYGEKALSNAELLAIIIKTGSREETSVQLAQRILKLNNNEEAGINFLRNISLQELMQIKGIGKVKAIQLKAVAELANRMSIPMNPTRIKIVRPENIAKIMMKELRFQEKEIMKIVILNIKNEIMAIKDVAFGGINITKVYPRDIIELPIKMNSPKIILVHNHPSGDSKPSKEDIEFTKCIFNITNSVGIQLIDHLVIGHNTYTSILSDMFNNTKDNKMEA